MFIAGIVLAGFVGVLVAVSAANSAQLTSVVGVRRAVIALGLVAGATAAATLWQTLAPGDPAVEGDLKAEGDALTLGAVERGLLYVEIVPGEGSSAAGAVLDVQLLIAGADARQTAKTRFQIGDSKVSADDDGSSARAEHLASNVVLDPTGADTTVTLAGLSRAGRAVVRVAYQPHTLPVRALCFALIVFAVLACLYEGAAPTTYQRSFFTVCTAGAAGMCWLLQDGLTATDGFWTLTTFIGYGVVIGAVAGSLGPMITGAVLPTLPGVEPKR